MDFSRVLVTDGLAWELFAAAARERLLFVRDPDEQKPRTGHGNARQRVLSLLVLFDRLVIHELGAATFRLPDLEKDGIVEVIPGGQPLGDAPALRTKWRKGRLALRERPPKNLLQSLVLIQQFRPLVLNRLLKPKGDFDSLMAGVLKVSRRKYLDLLIDYAMAYAQGDEVLLRDHTFTQTLCEDHLRAMMGDLFDYAARGNSLSQVNAILLVAAVFAEEIASIQNLSTKLGLGVATEYYGEKFRSEPALREKELDAITAANHFLILRAALADEGRFMPRIEGIKHALLLRKDPYLQAVREQLKLFHSGLTAGDRNAVVEARREIQKARRRVAHRSGWDRALRYLAYLSVPVGIAESLMWNIPIGTSLSIIGAAGAAASRRIEKRDEWVLFGS
jgi:hypothetical protein